MEGRISVMIGHLTALVQVVGVTEELADELEKGVTTDQRGAQFPVAGNDPVGFGQGERAPDNRRFFARRSDEKADPPLPLEGDHPLVKPAIEQHQLVKVSQVRRRERRRLLGPFQSSRPDEEFAKFVSAFSSIISFASRVVQPALTPAECGSTRGLRGCPVWPGLNRRVHRC